MNLPCLGIDIAKVKFNVCLLQSNGKLKHKVFPTHAAGFAQLQEWLAKHQASLVHACLEATGTYGEALSHFLHDRGHTVSVINPAAIKAFAASRLSRTKTDRVDAELIARFCLAHQPPPWIPPVPGARELQALVRRLESLIRHDASPRGRRFLCILSLGKRASVSKSDRTKVQANVLSGKSSVILSTRDSIRVVSSIREAPNV